MADDLVSGRVTSFKLEQGFGVITLDDGRTVKFDASACTMVPEEGAAVQLRVAPAKWGGGFKALHVEPRGSSVLIVPTPLTLDQQIALLQAEHLVSALSEQVMTELVDEVFGGQLGDATLLAVIDAFYVQDRARARHDGYLRHTKPFQPSTADILAEIAALIPDAAIPRQLSWAVRTLQVRLPDGSERSLDVESLDDIVFLVNDTLRAAGDLRRLFPLQTTGDWHAYFVLSAERAKRLASILPFAKPPQAIN